MRRASDRFAGLVALGMLMSACSTQSHHIPMPQAVSAPAKSGSQGCKVDRSAPDTEQRRFAFELCLFQAGGIAKGLELDDFAQPLSAQAMLEAQRIGAVPPGITQWQLRDLTAYRIALYRVAYLRGITEGTVPPPTGMSIPSDAAIRADYNQWLRDVPPLLLTATLIGWDCTALSGDCLTDEERTALLSEAQTAAEPLPAQASRTQLRFTNASAASPVTDDNLRLRERLASALAQIDPGESTNILRFTDRNEAGFAILHSKVGAAPVALRDYSAIRKAGLIEESYARFLREAGAATYP